MTENQMRMLPLVTDKPIKWSTKAIERDGKEDI